MVRNSREIIENVFKAARLSLIDGITLESEKVFSGFKELDKLTKGWHNGDLIVIASEKGMGNTSFAISMIIKMATELEYGVGLFSLDLYSIQLMRKLIESKTGISRGKLESGNLQPNEWERFHDNTKIISKAPIFIDDSQFFTILELRERARELVSSYGAQIIVIDKLDLIDVNEASGKNREDEISNICRNLKILAKELEVPIIVLSDLNRTEESTRKSKRPSISDLNKNSGIIQFSDVLLFIYRPEYYGLTEWDDEPKSSCEGQAEIIVESNRRGGIDTIRLKYFGYSCRFEELNSVE